MTSEPLLTGRLLLRPWQPSDAVVLHALWSERDPRVPPHRRLDAAGEPTVEELAGSIRRSTTGALFAVQLRETGETIGFCGLVDGEAGAPTLAYELLQTSWGRGLGSEAAAAVVDHARSLGHDRLQAWVWHWNTASRRILRGIGFAVVRREEDQGALNLLYELPLPPAQVVRPRSRLRGCP